MAELADPLRGNKYADLPLGDSVRFILTARDCVSADHWHWKCFYMVDDVTKYYQVDTTLRPTAHVGNRRLLLSKHCVR